MTLWELYEKSTVFKSMKGGEKMSESVSLFVCGIVLKELLCPEVTFSEEAFSKEKKQYSLDEIWYMICLHHGRQLGKEKIWKKRKPSFPLLFSYTEEGVRFTNSACVRQCPIFEAEMVDEYYFRRVCCGEEMDHGMAGGLVLHENLIRRYRGHYEDADSRTRNLYSYAANTLMVHNLFEPEKTKYRITSETDPLLFLLLLAESIEPLQYKKRTADQNVLLTAVQLEFRGGGMILIPDETYYDIEAMAFGIKRAQEKTGADFIQLQNSSEISVSW